MFFEHLKNDDLTHSEVNSFLTKKALSKARFFRSFLPKSYQIKFVEFFIFIGLKNQKVTAEFF